MRNKSKTKRQILIIKIKGQVFLKFFPGELRKSNQILDISWYHKKETSTTN